MGDVVSGGELEFKKLELERYKANLDFRKFLWGSVFAALALATIPALFQLATAGLEYVKSEEKLKTDRQQADENRKASEEHFREEFIKGFVENALSKDIDLRIRLAEYFKYVSAQSFRQGWVDYHTSLLARRDETRAQIIQMEIDDASRLAAKSPDEIKAMQLKYKIIWAYKDIGTTRSQGQE